MSEHDAPEELPAPDLPAPDAAEDEPLPSRFELPLGRAISRAMILGVVVLALLVGLLTLRDRGLIPGLSPRSQLSYSHLDEAGRPARWDPCAPIPYLVSQPALPPGGLEVLQREVRRVALASGLRFSYEGLTDERPSPARPASDPRYEGEFSPVLIAWVGDTPSLGENTLGEARVHVVGDSQRGFEIVTGQITLARTDAETIRHELGHLLGLGHAEDPQQLMWPTILDRELGPEGFGEGDLRGLRAVGAAAGCWNPTGAPADRPSVRPEG